MPPCFSLIGLYTTSLVVEFLSSFLLPLRKSYKIGTDTSSSLPLCTVYKSTTGGAKEKY
jgi:hypothetical protein